jgi:hypothetical protein
MKSTQWIGLMTWPAMLALTLQAQQSVTTTGGTVNVVPKFSAASSIVNSALVEVGGNIGIGNTTPPAPLSFNVNVGDKIQLYPGSGASRYGFGIQSGTLVQYISGLSGTKFSWRLSPSSGDASTGPEVANLLSTGAFNLFMQSSSANGFSINGAVSQTGNYLNLTTHGGVLGNVFVVNSLGNIGIGTSTPSSKLSVNGLIQSMSGGFKFPDNTVQTTATLVGPAGPQGPQGPAGPTGPIGGSGTSGFVPVWTSSTALGNSLLFQSGANVGVGTTTPLSKLDVSGDINLSGSIRKGGNIFIHDLGGAGNTALGLNALVSNTTSGTNNTAVGEAALDFNTSGCHNTAIGGSALNANSIGSYNTAIGFEALLQNTGSNNIAIGTWAGQSITTTSNNIDIGNNGSASDNGTVRIGTDGKQISFFAAGVRGVITGKNDAIPVVIDSAGQLGTTSSSRRYKQDIKDMGEASSGLTRLRPVKFHYRQHPDGNFEYGLVAEEVAEVYPDVVVYSPSGQPEAVQYDKINAMLLNEFQKQQHEIEALRARLAEMESLLRTQVASSTVVTPPVR